MRFINAVVILFVLTISAWKYGQANAAPTSWNSNEIKNTFNTDGYFNKYEHKQEFSVNSIFTKDVAVLNNDQTLNVKAETENGHGSTYSLWSQIAKYGPISADRGISIDTTHTIHGLGALNNKSNGKTRDPFHADIIQKVSYDGLISNGPIKISYNQISD